MYSANLEETQWRVIKKILRELCCNIKIILVDAGYRGEIVEKIKNVYGYILEVIVSGDKVKRL